MGCGDIGVWNRFQHVIPQSTPERLHVQLETQRTKVRNESIFGGISSQAESFLDSDQSPEEELA